MIRPALTWLLATALAGAAVAVTTPPINLGATDLDLELRLWLYDGTSWESAAVDGLTIEDLATGEYTVLGLPTATGTDRYSLHIATEADPDVALASYTYGAQPGQRIVWRQEITLPPSPLVFKAGDSYGSISIVIAARLPAAACAPETTVEFFAWSIDSAAAAFDGEAELSDCELDSTTGTYGATLTYDLTSGDLAAAGRFRGEFQVCYSVSSCHTLPSDNRLEWRVLARLQ